MIFWPNWKPAPRGPTVCAVIGCNELRHEHDGIIRRWCEEHAKEWDDSVAASASLEPLNFNEALLTVQLEETMRRIEERLWPSK